MSPTRSYNFPYWPGSSVRDGCRYGVEYTHSAPPKRATLTPRVQACPSSMDSRVLVRDGVTDPREGQPRNRDEECLLTITWFSIQLLRVADRRSGRRLERKRSVDRCLRMSSTEGLDDSLLRIHECQPVFRAGTRWRTNAGARNREVP